jgi:hypothetical protein
MYVCDKHGALDSEWCEQCGEIVACDCSDMAAERVWITYMSGDRNHALIVRYCGTCGCSPTVSDIKEADKCQK